MTDVEVKYFETIPWCAKLLNDPDFVFFPTPSRRRKESTEDALFGETLKTDATIRACVSLYRRPERSGGAQIEEVRTLFALGDGVNGYPHSCHGGIVATIVDEVMGLLISVNRDREDLTATVVTLTASLNVVYLKPVETPQTVLVTARFREITGRKLYLEATVKNGDGVTLAEANALWIRVNATREKL